MKELFDNPSTCSSIWFPSQLTELTRQIPGQVYDPDELIQKHTLIPYFAPFIPPERATRLVETIKTYVSSSANMILGRTAFAVKPKLRLFYCDLCVREDREKYGEAYWRRSHQVEGVYLCPVHHNWLVQSKISHQMRLSRYRYIMLEHALQEAGESCFFPNQTLDHLQFISEQTQFLLDNQLSSPGLLNISLFYISKLRRNGFIYQASNRIRWDKLLASFKGHYGEAFLSELNGEVGKEDSWLHKLLRKPRVACHPLRHILLLGFLGESVESMMNEISKGSNQFDPFGQGPWPCLNKAADHYMEQTITSCKITRGSKTGKPVGTFACNCGFVYSRSGPDIIESDRYRVGRVKEFGDVWIKKLAEMSNQDLAARSQAKLLGCDPQTVINQRKLLIFK